MLNRLILFIFSLFLFVQTSFASGKPRWVKQRPSDVSYYIGVGKVLKSEHLTNYAKVARDKALKELSGEITVTISVNSMLHQFEDNYQFKETFEAKTKTFSEQTLEGYEVKTWENRKEYWVMMRLSKDKFELLKRMKLDKCKLLASNYCRDARIAKDNNDIYGALNFYKKAIFSVKDHVGEDLTIRSVDGTYNLVTSIYSEVQEIFQRIKILPVKENYQFQFSKDMKIPLMTQVSFQQKNGDGKLINGFPLFFKFTKGSGELVSQSVTNSMGEANCSITQLNSARKRQEVMVAFDMDHFLSNESEMRLIEELFFPMDLVPKAFFKIEVIKSMALLSISEDIFGKSTSGSLSAFSSTVLSDLNQNFFAITIDSVDAIFDVNCKASFRKGVERKGQGYSVYIVYADFIISVTDRRTGAVIFTDNFSGLKGMRPGSYDYALQEVMDRAISQFKQQVIPKMEKVDL